MTENLRAITAIAWMSENMTFMDFDFLGIFQGKYAGLLAKAVA